MAADWIKVEMSLPDKPEVHYIASVLKLDPDAVVGKLFRVWSWFDTHTENGDALGVTFALLDRIAGVTGFGEAMHFAGWVEQRDKVLRMVNFTRHNGKSAKKRALTAERMKRLRDAPNVTVASLEKRREEVKEAPADAGPIWSECLTILTEQKVSEKSARSFLGLMCREYEQSEVVNAVKASVGKADAVAYIRGVLKASPKKGERARPRLAI